MAMTDEKENDKTIQGNETDPPFDLDSRIDNIVSLGVKRQSTPPEAEWSGLVLRAARGGRIVENIPNCVTILAYDRRWDGVLAYNEFERRVFVKKELPWREVTEALEEPRPFSNHDLLHVQMWLQNEKFGGAMWTIGAEAVSAAVNLVARQGSYHPVKELFSSLPAWDGVPRLDTWLVDITGCPDTPYAQMVGRMFLLGLYRRMMAPGCKMDYMLILEGAQGLGKSSLAKELVYDIGFGEAHFKDLSSADTSIFLRNKWLVEFGEMHALRKAEINEIKMFLVKQAEDYRPKYGRENAVEPRQNAFIGTSNGSEYLNDPSGGRRFWPIACEKIDMPKFLEMREQLWAEIVVRAETGESHFPSPEQEAEFFAPEQSTRMVVDPWDNVLFPAVERMNRVTHQYIFSKLGIPPQQLNSHILSRVKEIFNKRGWKKGKSNQGVYYQNPVINKARTLNPKDE